MGKAVKLTKRIMRKEQNRIIKEALKQIIDLSFFQRLKFCFKILKGGK